MRLKLGCILIGVGAHRAGARYRARRCSPPPLLLSRVLTTGRYRLGHTLIHNLWATAATYRPQPTDCLVSRRAAGDGAHSAARQPGKRTAGLAVYADFARRVRLVTAARSVRAVTAAISHALPRVVRRVGYAMTDMVRVHSPQLTAKPRSGRSSVRLRVFNRAAEVTVTKAGLCTT